MHVWGLHPKHPSDEIFVLPRGKTLIALNAHAYFQGLQQTHTCMVSNKNYRQDTVGIEDVLRPVVKLILHKQPE